MKLLSCVNSYQVFQLNNTTTSSSYGDQENHQNQIPKKGQKKHQQQSKKKKHDAVDKKEVTIISEFSMPTACSQLKLSEDGNFIFLSGSYGPQIKCFELCELSEKFRRGIRAQCQKFEILSADHSKFCVLNDENSVEFHTGRQMYHSFKLPQLARDLNISRENAEIYFPSTHGKVNRFNLEIGRFFKPFEAADELDLFCGDVNGFHSLYACGASNGKVLFFDPRSQETVNTLDLPAKIPAASSPSAIKFKNAFNFGVGYSSGHVFIHDLRTKTPVTSKDHLYRFPVRDIQFIDNDYCKNTVMTSDKKAIKFWNDSTGQTVTSIESKEAIHNALLLPGSGMVMAACQAPDVQVFFVPKIGPAPTWCSYLDDIVNTIENEPQPLDEHDDKKFVTIEDLKMLNLKHLLGTGVLKAYMHGYLMPLDVYHRAVDQKSVIEQSDNLATLEGFYRSKAENYLERLTASKIAVKDDESGPRVNKSLYSKAKSDPSAKKSKLLSDDRFSALFKDVDFEIDQEDENFVLNSIVTERNAQNGNQDSSDDEEVKEYRKEIRQNLHRIRQREHIEQINNDKNATIEIPDDEDNGHPAAKSNKTAQKVKMVSEKRESKSLSLASQLNEPDSNSRKKKETKTESKKKKVIQKHMEQRKASIRNFKGGPKAK